MLDTAISEDIDTIFLFRQLFKGQKRAYKDQSYLIHHHFRLVLHASQPTDQSTFKDLFKIICYY